MHVLVTCYLDFLIDQSRQLNGKHLPANHSNRSIMYIGSISPSYSKEMQSQWKIDAWACK